MKIMLSGLLALLLAPAALADELIIFSLPGCRPCAALEQLLEENPELTQGFVVSKVDIGEQPETAEVFNVSSTPTIVRLDDKTREISRKVGLMTRREMRRWLDDSSK
jgi:thioredoxin-like negative regulator of GroEL